MCFCHLSRDRGWKVPKVEVERDGVPDVWVALAVFPEVTPASVIGLWKGFRMTNCHGIP